MNVTGMWVTLCTIWVSEKCLHVTGLDKHCFQSRISGTSKGCFNTSEVDPSAYNACYSRTTMHGYDCT